MSATLGHEGCNDALRECLDQAAADIIGIDSEKDENGRTCISRESTIHDGRMQ